MIYEKKTGYHMSHRDAELFHNNEKYPISSLDKNGEIIESEKNSFHEWVCSSDERYDSLIFDPSKPSGPAENHWNIWKGWKYEPSKKGPCKLYLDHMKQNICNGSIETYNYLLDWMSQIIQEPTNKITHSIAIKGDQGSGKGVFVNIFMKLFGKSAVEISDSETLTQQFNSILENKLLIHGDEAFWSGDRKNRGKLKNLITSDTIRITYKGKDTITMPNYLRFIFTTNEDWSAPIEKGDRRWVTLRCGNNNRNDKKYFGKMITEMEEGGYEKLMYILLNRDISKRDWTEPPVTDAMKEDLVLTSARDNILVDYFTDCLDGTEENNFFTEYELNKANHGKYFIKCGTFITYIRRYIRDRGLRIDVTDMYVSRKLKQIFGTHFSSQQKKIQKKNCKVYAFGNETEIQMEIDTYKNTISL